MMKTEEPIIETKVVDAADVQPAQPVEVPKDRICSYCNRPVEMCNDRFDIFGQDNKLIAEGIKLVWAKGVK